jgi:hypothetical protein
MTLKQLRAQVGDSGLGAFGRAKPRGCQPPASHREA